MNPILSSLTTVITQPTPAALWQLRGDLLAGDVPASAPALHTCAQMQPEMAATQRRRLIDDLLSPLLLPDVSGAAKAALIARLFQLLLLAHLSPHLAAA